MQPWLGAVRVRCSPAPPGAPLEKTLGWRAQLVERPRKPAPKQRQDDQEAIEDQATQDDTFGGGADPRPEGGGVCEGVLGGSSIPMLRPKRTTPARGLD